MLEAQYLIGGHRILLQVASSLYWRSLHELYVRLSLLSFSAESFVFQFAIQTFKD